MRVDCREAVHRVTFDNLQITRLQVQKLVQVHVSRAFVLRVVNQWRKW